jgi:chitinase
MSMMLALAFSAPAFVFSPYKFVALPYDRPTESTLSLAFATGECGEEKWSGPLDEKLMQHSYIISTGGQGGVFTCATDAGMEKFVTRYLSPRLVGIDFDIEAGQTPQQVESLIRRAMFAQRRWPHLRYSFTVATHAASDGSRQSLNGQGEGILAALRKAGMRDYVLNLMVMDYGEASPKVCVVRKGRCDMGASAAQAARNVHAKYGVPYRQIALTAMIGVNDVVSNVHSPEDVRRMVRDARRLKLAGLHYWSHDRDTPCAVPVKGADSRCSGMDLPAGTYEKTFTDSIRQR